MVEEGRIAKARLRSEYCHVEAEDTSAKTSLRNNYIKVEEFVDDEQESDTSEGSDGEWELIENEEDDGGLIIRG